MYFRTLLVISLKGTRSSLRFSVFSKKALNPIKSLSQEMLRERSAKDCNFRNPIFFMIRKQ
jgi:hypothetical protein